MARAEPVQPVKWLVAILWSDAALRDEAQRLLMARWGNLDFVGPDHPFDVTDYYVPEMGAGIFRRLVSFAELLPPEAIRAAKLACNDWEDELACRAGQSGRRVNLDIGYLDHNKLVLASLKFAGQKIHLGDGVYADLIARYAHGRYQPFEWTFPDFKTGRYDDELGKIRRQYMEQLRLVQRFL